LDLQVALETLSAPLDVEQIGAAPLVGDGVQTVEDDDEYACKLAARVDLLGVLGFHAGSDQILGGYPRQAHHRHDDSLLLPHA